MQQDTTSKINQFLSRKANQYPRLDLTQHDTTVHLNRFL